MVMNRKQYTKEFLLAAFKVIESPPEKDLWHCPESVVVSQTPQQPMAFSPLSPHEKQLLESGNVNSQQANRRQQQAQHQQRKQHGGRMRGGKTDGGFNDRRNFQHDRRKQQDALAVASPEESSDAVAPEDLWDSPDNAAGKKDDGNTGGAQIGVFANGKYVVPPQAQDTAATATDAGAAVAKLQAPERQRKSRFATFFSSATEGEEDMEQDEPAVSSTGILSSAQPLSNSLNALTQIPGTFPLASKPQSHPDQSAMSAIYQQQQQQQAALSRPQQGPGSLGMRAAAQEPLISAVSSAGALSHTRPTLPEIRWVYKDPQGIIQGPFGCVEMQQWFEAGYFPDSLLIKQTTDDRFEEMIYYMQRFGAIIFSRPSPSFFEQFAPSLMAGGWAGGHQLPPPQQSFSVEQQQRLEFMQQQQQQQQLMGRSQKTAQMPISSPTDQIVVSPDKSRLPSPRKTTPAAPIEPPTKQQQQQHQQQHQHQHSPGQAVDALSQRLQVAASVSGQQQRRKQQPKGSDNLQRQEDGPISQNDGSLRSPTTASEPAWQQQKNGKRLSLREIQQQEKQEQEQRLQQRQQEAQEKLKREITAAQQQQAQTDASKLPLNWANPASQQTATSSTVIAWGGTSSQETKKSLLEIQQEEEREAQRRAMLSRQQRQSSEALPATSSAGAGRKYAETASIAGSSWSSKASAGIQPSSAIPPHLTANSKSNGSGSSNNGLSGSLNDAQSSSSMESLHTAPSRSGSNTPLKPNSNPAAVGTLEDVVQWCRDQLRPLEERLDIGSFMEILIPLKDPYMIAEIVHDAVGANYNRLNPQHFLQEYLQRRHQVSKSAGKNELIIPPPPQNSPYAVAVRNGTYKPAGSSSGGGGSGTVGGSSSKKKDSDKGFIQVVRKGKSGRSKRGEEIVTGAPVGVGGRTVVGATLKSP